MDVPIISGKEAIPNTSLSEKDKEFISIFYQGDLVNWKCPFCDSIIGVKDCGLGCAPKPNEYVDDWRIKINFPNPY